MLITYSLAEVDNSSNSNSNEDVFVSEYTLDKLNQNATKTQMVAFSMDPKDHTYDVVGQITDQLILKPKGTAYRQGNTFNYSLTDSLTHSLTY